MRYMLLLLAPLLLLSACATLSEDECRSGNWYQIGLKDGENGRQASFLSQHAKACRDYGITPVASDWERGRRDGLPKYCTPARAFEEGARGKHLSPVCPASQLAQLERANERGLAYHRVTQEIGEIEREISSINAEIARLAPGDPARGALASERSFLRLELLALRSERARLRRY